MWVNRAHTLNIFSLFMKFGGPFWGSGRVSTPGYHSYLLVPSHFVNDSNLILKWMADLICLPLFCKPSLDSKYSIVSQSVALSGFCQSASQIPPRTVRGSKQTKRIRTIREEEGQERLFHIKHLNYLTIGLKHPAN